MVAKDEAKRRRGFTLSIIILSLFQILITEVQARPDVVTGPAARSAYGRLPLAFVRNDGQLQGDIRYYERGAGQALYFAADGITLALARNTTDSPASPATIESIRLLPVGANADPSLIAEQRLPGHVNYFTGNDRGDWHSGIPTFAAVRYGQIYPGIDLRFHGDNEQLEYDFIVSSGARPDDIVMAYEGIEGLRVAEDGALIVSLADGQLVQKPPYIYQDIDGRRVPVDGRFHIKSHEDGGPWRYGFELAAYDSSRPLIIDPVLSYSTYLGGGNHDRANDIVVNSAGEAFIVGSTLSMDFPQVNPYQGSGTADYFDVFVSRINASGNALVYSTFLGGNNHDVGKAIAIDAANNAYVTGWTDSGDFPMQGAIQATPVIGHDTAFVTKLDATGGGLLYSTYLGGSRDDHGEGIAVDINGNIYVAGNTRSHDFPTMNPLYTSASTGNNKDAFVTKLNAAGSAYVYSTYLGGDNEDRATSIAVDSSGNAYVTGWTESLNFPTTASAYSTAQVMAFSGAYITKLDAAGSQLLYSTYLSGGNDDVANDIAADDVGNAYIVGATRSHDFPTMNPIYTAADTGNNNDAFIAKVDTTASGNASLVYSTYIGGDNRDSGSAIAVNGAGEAYITGKTRSLNFPSTGSPFQPTSGGDLDAFVTRINATGTALVYSSYLGGSNEDSGSGIAVDSVGNAYVTGCTRSTDFPVLSPYQSTTGSVDYTDAFITKIQ